MQDMKVTATGYDFGAAHAAMRRLVDGDILSGDLGEKKQLRHRYFPTACRTACNTPSRS